MKTIGVFSIINWLVFGVSDRTLASAKLATLVSGVDAERLPLTRSSADYTEQSDIMENQPETGPASSTHMEALITLLQQQIERLAQQQADRDARQEERDARRDELDARREERFVQQLAQLDERLTEQLHLHLNEVREAFVDEVKRVHHELSAPSETPVPVQTVVRRKRSVMQQRPPKYDGKSICETFRAQFEIVAELNEWTSTEMAAFLATSLEGSGGHGDEQKARLCSPGRCIGNAIRYGCAERTEQGEIAKYTSAKRRVVGSCSRRG